MKKIIPLWVTYSIFFISAFLFVFLFSCTTSPMYERYPFWFHGDSGIFQEMGVCLVQGGTPYVDLFDHKGPILWFIQALGIWINPKWGLAFLQSLFLSANLIIWYKIVLLFVRKHVFVNLILGLGLFFLMCFYLRGNLCEEWSLPFISLPIFIFLKRINNNTAFNLYDTFIIGLCIGTLTMIRMNNIAPFLGFVLWFFVILIKESKWKTTIISAILMITGIIAVIIPCLLFYYHKARWNGVEEMLFGTFGFNFTYFADNENQDLFQCCRYYVPMAGFFVATCLCVKRNNSNITIPILISYFVTYFSLGNKLFYHYMMICIPLFIVTLCLLFQSVSKLGYVILGIVIINYFVVSHSAIDCLAHRLLSKPTNTDLNDGFHRFASSLSPKEKNSIYNENLNHIAPGLFAKENIFQCNRFLSKHHYESSPRLRDYYKTHRIEKLQPLWVLTQSPRPEVSDEYLTTNYTLADSIPGGEFDPIWCWKKTK